MAIRNALVTGCDYGLGLEFVKVLCKNENFRKIFAGCVDPKSATELVKLSQENSNIVPIQLRVDDDESIESAKNLIESQIGSEGLDLLINNAGINQNDGWVPGKGWVNLNRAHMLKHLNINTLGPVMLTHALLPDLRNGAKLNSKSVVLNISSDRASISLARTYQEDFNCPSLSYGLSKAALNHLTSTLSYYETKNNVISIAVHPGWIVTPMGGPKATFSASESAEKILKLVSNLTVPDSGRYMNRDGQDLDL
uniref:Uncharacterized protein n=1 Tax=Acrobeloides nanus TaxID=290746 RepID=A0A914EBG8_9BILA